MHCPGGVKDSADLATTGQEAEQDAAWPVAPRHVRAARERL